MLKLVASAQSKRTYKIKEANQKEEKVLYPSGQSPRGGCNGAHTPPVRGGILRPKDIKISLNGGIKATKGRK